MASVFLALAWLLPNHYPPWTSFHMEAAAALAIAPMAIWITWFAPYRLHRGFMGRIGAVCVAIPLLQWLAGEITYLGTAWICSAYLLGLVLAINTGKRWEIATPGQCADYLFLAIGLAAVLSTVLQFYQLSDYKFLGTWVMAVPQRLRLYANVAQPNQLASLQMLGLLGVFWGVNRARLGNIAALAISALLLAGVALTGSRTAYLNMLVLVLAAHGARRWGLSPKIAWSVSALGAYLVLCGILLPTLYNALDIPVDTEAIRQHSFSFSARLQIWAIALQASLLHPVAGFGWGQIPLANFLMAEQAPDGLGMFNSSHNLFIDLLLWNGYPVGILLMIAILVWLVWVVRSIATIEQCCYFLFLLILATHALLELPLQYAYFLLPWGMVVGALESSVASDINIKRNHRLLALIPLLVAAVVLLVTIRDYLKIETRNYGVRFESAGIATKIPRTPPEVWVLDQFNEFFSLVRNHPAEGLAKADLDRMRDSVNTVPSALTMFNLAANLALNGEPQEARHWQITLCKVMPDINCQEAQLKWEKEGYAERTGWAWPSAAAQPAQPAQPAQ